MHERDDACRTAPVAAVVVAARDPSGFSGLNKFPGADQDWRTDGNPEGTAGIVRFGIDHDLLTQCEPFTLAEVGEYVRIAPTGGAALSPRVGVSWMASDPRHVIEPGRASEHLAAGDGDPSSVKP